MDKNYTQKLNEIIEYNLDKLDPNETVEVNLKDLMYIYSTLQEYMRFFHNESHYKNMDDIKKFLGNYDTPAAFEALRQSVYSKMSNMMPQHIDDKFDEGFFDSPLKPFYFEPRYEK